MKIENYSDEKFRETIFSKKVNILLYKKATKPVDKDANKKVKTVRNCEGRISISGSLVYVFK